jgi:hypothetical protein
MVKSNLKPMPKTRRKVEVDRELLNKFLDLLERARESDKKNAEVLADVHRLQERLRRLASS